MKIVRYFGAATATIFLCLTLLSSCVKYTSLSTAEMLGFFTSERCGGRLVGSEGNQVAANFIQEHFSALNLQFYSDASYALPYIQQDTYFPNQSFYNLEVAVNGVWERLLLGEEYLPLIYQTRQQGDYALVQDIEADSVVQSALLLPDITQMKRAMEKNPAALLFCSESMTTGIQADGSLFRIKLTGKGLDKLEEGTRIRFDFQSKIAPAEAENIVGILPGTDRTKAIIFSAHFDHVGTVGSILFPGAYDNASGITALLRLAEQLKVAGTPPVDIIFCAFNGEENGQQGSTAFTNALDHRYSFGYAINLDCVGSLDTPNTYSVYSDGTTNELNQALAAALEVAGLQAGDGGYMRSDHLSFSGEDFCAVTIGQDVVPEVHTAADTTQVLLAERIDTLCQALMDFVASSAHADYPRNVNAVAGFDIQGTQVQSVADAFWAEAALPYEKQYIFCADGIPYYLTGNRALTTQKEVYQYYPNLQIPDLVARLPFKSFMSCVALSEFLHPDVARKYLGEFSGAPVIVGRPLIQQGEEKIVLTYQSGSRILEIAAINESSGQYKNEDIVLGLSAGEEVLEGDYAGYILRYGNIGEGYFDGFSCRLVDSPFTLYVRLSDRENFENGGVIYEDKVILDLGANKRDDILALIDELRATPAGATQMP